MCDVGCYTGDFTLKIGKAVGASEILGVELSEFAAAEATDRGIKVQSFDVSRVDWPLLSNSIDFVYSNQVIEHLYSVDNFLNNIIRVLKPGGYALISTGNMAAWHNVFSLFLGYQPFSTSNICTKKWTIGNPFSQVVDGHNDPLMIHRAVFSLVALREFMSIYDMDIVEEYCSGYYPLPNNFIGNTMADFDSRHAVYIAVLVRRRP